MKCNAIKMMCHLVVIAVISGFVVPAAHGDTLDVSSGLDDAGDYGSVILEWKNNTATVTGSITDVAGPQVRFNTTRSSGGDAILSMLSSATFDPSTQGSINGIDWSARVEHVGSANNLFPMLSQGGALYVYKGGGITNAEFYDGNAFYNTTPTTDTLSLTGAVEAEFEELDLVTPSILAVTFQPETIAASNPDFSTAGGLITFGYVSLSDSGTARNNNSDLDNVSVIVDFNAPVIPTPAALPAGLAMMLALGIRRRYK